MFKAHAVDISHVTKKRLHACSSSFYFASQRHITKSSNSCPVSWQMPEQPEREGEERASPSWSMWEFLH